MTELLKKNVFFFFLNKQSTESWYSEKQTQ